MDIKQLREIIRILNEEKLTEITVASDDERITVRREPGAEPPVLHQDEDSAEKQVVEAEEGTFTVDAPLVGTFYARPSPEEEPFVEPGAAVETDQPICVIEAMKVMNEITADRPGRVKRVLVSDGDTVEYGQPLFLLEEL